MQETERSSLSYLIQPERPVTAVLLVF